MYILGIDASLSSTGIAIINENKELLAIKTIKPVSKNNRISIITDEIAKIIKKYNIKYIKMEEGFGKTFTALKLAELRGAIKYIAEINNIEVKTIAPQSIKKQITGSGRADKKEVYKKLKEIYKDNKLFDSIGEFLDKGKSKNDDMYDAIAIALSI